MAAPLTVTLVAPEAVQAPARAAVLLAYLRELSPGTVYEVNPNAEQVAEQGRSNVIFVWGLSGSADWTSSFPRESFFQLRESASDLMGTIGGELPAAAAWTVCTADGTGGSLPLPTSAGKALRERRQTPAGAARK